MQARQFTSRYYTRSYLKGPTNTASALYGCMILLPLCCVRKGSFRPGLAKESPWEKPLLVNPIFHSEFQMLIQTGKSTMLKSDDSGGLFTMIRRKIKVPFHLFHNLYSLEKRSLCQKKRHKERLNPRGFHKRARNYKNTKWFVSVGFMNKIQKLLQKILFFENYFLDDLSCI